MKDIFIARDKECATLRDCLLSERSEFIIIYGRRRIGKTYLIDRFFDGNYDFTFVGAHRATQQVQLRNFAKALKKYTQSKTAPSFANWYDAFDALEEYLETQPTERKKVVFIDEMPWIDTQKSEFVNALENFWNGWANRRTDIMFIATGSATSWMADKLIDNQGGLHARITANIYLRPFTLAETEQYLRIRGCRWDRYQILQCYMLFGGVPFYLRQLNIKDSLAQNVDRLFFAVNGVMRMEFDELYHALFNYSDQYINIVKALANHREGMTRNELAKECNTAGDRLTKVLKNLERCDFIAKSTQYGNKKKDAIYRLIDLYTLFYYKFIDNDTAEDPQWWSNNIDARSVSSWMGLCFELVCLMHKQQIKRALGLAVVSTNIAAWRQHRKASEHEGAQIDLIIERADRIIHLCELKFSTSEYRITEEYEQKLRHRMALFNEATNTRKTLVNTFITTFGVVDGKHKSIVHSEVTMDDLFNH